MANPFAEFPRPFRLKGHRRIDPAKRMVLSGFRTGKGRKDRLCPFIHVLSLPPKLLDITRDYWKRTHPEIGCFPGSAIRIRQSDFSAVQVRRSEPAGM